jgi:hypothetical protein
MRHRKLVRGVERRCRAAQPSPAWKTTHVAPPVGGGPGMPPGLQRELVEAAVTGCMQDGKLSRPVGRG